MAITEKWLRANSISQSFQRGRGYQESVQQLAKQGNVYTATVYGTSRYKVKIIDDSNDIECSCNCPYDLDGFCKHIIAVGLCIIEGDFKSKSMTLPTTQSGFVGKQLPIDKLNFYDRTFSVARQSQQATFLRALFAEDENLCRRFLAFQQPLVLSQEAAPIAVQALQLPKTVDDFSECSQTIAGIIMAIDTDPYMKEESDMDYDDYDEYGEYEEEEETHDTEALTQTVENQLNPYYQQCLTLLQQRKVLDSFYGLLCLYEASFLVESEDWMESEDRTYQDMMYEDWTKKVPIWVSAAKNIFIQKADYQLVMELIWQRRDYFARFQKTSDDYIPYSSFAEMEDLITWATPTIETKRLCLNELQDRNLLVSKNHSVTLLLCNGLNDNELLLNCFEKYGSEYSELSLEWLKRLLEVGNRPKWVQTAHKIYNANALKSKLNPHFFPKTNAALDDYIFQNLKLEDNLVFFKAFMGAYARERQNLVAYQYWKAVASLAELELYYHELRTNNPSFYIQLMKADEKYDDLLAYAKSLVTDSRNTFFVEATEPILNVKDDAVLKLYKERILHQMDTSSKKTREIYAAYISGLKPVLKMTKKGKEVKGFSDLLRSRYMRYPAFVDELKKAGF
ncbi:MAG: hypothetical protein RIS64_2127 [Bacteroidota bacterium]